MNKENHSAIYVLSNLDDVYLKGLYANIVVTKNMIMELVRNNYKVYNTLSKGNKNP